MKNLILICARLIHLVNKKNCGNLVVIKKLPKKPQLACYAVCSTYDKNCHIKNL